MDLPFIGEITIVAFGYPPVGWALCDGSLLPIQGNEALYSLIGTMYGGNGTTNFGLPDLRGRIPVGMGTGPGLTPVTQGEKAGVENVALASPELPLHSHNVAAAAAGGRGATQNPNGCVYAANASAPIWAPPPTPAVAMNSAMVASSGGSQAHENRMPYLALNYYIALQGLYPTRP
jgi:microcystin-dependent protein